MRVKQRPIGGKGMNMKISGETPSRQRRELVLRLEAGQDKCGRSCWGSVWRSQGSKRVDGPLGSSALSLSEEHRILSVGVT